MTSVHRTRGALRSRLANGEPVTGTFVKLGSCDVVELAAAAGLDFIVVDLEHSVLDERDAVALVRTADLCGLAALVRLPAVQPGLIARLLESGAAGIQLSTLRTVEQSRQLRAACRFAPEGEPAEGVPWHAVVLVVAGIGLLVALEIALAFGVAKLVTGHAY